MAEEADSSPGAGGAGRRRCAAGSGPRSSTGTGERAKKEEEPLGRARGAAPGGHGRGRTGGHGESERVGPGTGSGAGDPRGPRGTLGRASVCGDRAELRERGFVPPSPAAGLAVPPAPDMRRDLLEFARSLGPWRSGYSFAGELHARRNATLIFIRIANS